MTGCRQVQSRRVRVARESGCGCFAAGVTGYLDGREAADAECAPLNARCGGSATHCGREGSAGESRAAPTDSTPRRERQDEAAGTRCLSRPRRSDWSRAACDWRASGLWPEDRYQEGRSDATGSRGTRVANGQQRTRLAAPRWRTCGREGAGRSSRGGAQPLVAASEGASLGGSGAGTAGFASNVRRGDPGVQLAAAIVCVMAGQARARAWLAFGPRPRDHDQCSPSVSHRSQPFLLRRILQPSSLARHWARDWRALALTQVHHSRKINHHRVCIRASPPCVLEWDSI